MKMGRYIIDSVVASDSYSDSMSVKKRLSLWDRWLMKISTKAWQKNNDYAVLPIGAENGCIKQEYAAKINRDLSDNHRSNSLKWYKAHGGMIIEISTYNDKLHEWNNELYIVPEGARLADEISSIIMQQFLRS
jgi:hypothetical protein